MRRSLIVIIVAFSLALPLSAQQQPSLIWDELIKENGKFAAGPSLTLDVSKRLPGGQQPAVTVLSCADSRVPPELVFNQTIGKLFVVRTAGNVASPFDIASIEYAIIQEPTWTRLIVVLGHSDCGAVKTALGGGTTDSTPINELLARIRESFIGIHPWSTDKPVLKQATKLNARQSAAYLVAHSQIIRAATTRIIGPVLIVSAYYDLDSGKVERIPD